MDVNGSHAENITTFRYIGVSIGIFDIVVGTFGNILTITAVLRNKVMCRHPFNMFIVNLSVIDLLTSLVMMPFNVTGYVLMEWPYSVEACIVQAFVYFSCGYTSIVCLIAITINRLLGTVYPDRYQFMNPTTMRVALFLCWLIAPFFLLPFLFASLLHNATGGQSLTGWKSEQLLCTFVHLSDGWVKYMRFTRFIFQLFPILIMIISYSIILYYVRKSNSRRKANVTSGYYQYQIKMHAMEEAKARKILESTSSERETHRIPSNENETEMENEAYEISHTGTNHNSNRPLSHKKLQRCRSTSHQMRRGQEVHLLKVSVIVCIVLILLFLPSFVINLIPGNSSFDARYHMLASNVTWLNSCVNPIIYFLLYEGMKKEYKNVLSSLYQWFKFVLCRDNR